MHHRTQHREIERPVGDELLQPLVPYSSPLSFFAFAEQQCAVVLLSALVGLRRDAVSPTHLADGRPRARSRHGKIRWHEEHDDVEKEHVVPMSQLGSRRATSAPRKARDRLMRIRGEVPQKGNPIAWSRKMALTAQLQSGPYDISAELAQLRKRLSLHHFQPVARAESNCRPADFQSALLRASA